MISPTTSPLFSASPQPALVNTTTGGEQAVLAVGALAGGGYQIAWTSNGSDLFVQRYDAAGAQAGAETRLDFSLGSYEAADIAVLSDGGIVVAYEALRPAAVLPGVPPTGYPTSGIYTLRFDASGGAAGAETEVVLAPNFGARTHDHATAPSVLSWGEGGYLVSWSLEHVSYMGTTADFAAQRYGTQGEAVGGKRAIGYGGIGAVSAEVTALADGGFMTRTFTLEQGTLYANFSIADSQDRAGDLAAILALHGDAFGLPAQSNLLPLANGGYVLWSSNDGVPFTQVFDSTGAAAGAAMAPLPATAIALGDGGFAVFRAEAGLQSDLLGQLHDSTGAAVGGQFRVDTNGAAPLFTALADGGLMVAWSGTGAGGDLDVFTQHFEAAPAEPGSLAAPAAAGVLVNGGFGRDALAGTSGDDTLRGGEGGDVLTGMAGNDVLEGGLGIDTAVYSGSRAGYAVARTPDGFTVSGADGTDTLRGVERLAFADGGLALDDQGSAGQAWRLYRAAFDRTPDDGGLGFWMRALDGGHGLPAVAQQFMDSPEFAMRYGAPDAAQFVAQLYANVLDRAPDEGGRAYWLDNLARDALTRPEALVYFSESAENQAALTGVMQNGMAYTL